MDLKDINDKIMEEEVADVPTLSEEPLEIDEEAGQADEELQKIAPVEETKVLKTASLNKKVLLAVLFVAVNLLAVLITVLMEFTSDTHPVPLSNVWGTIVQNWYWGVTGIVLFVLTIVFQALKRHALLYSTLKKRVLKISFNATVLCRYYDNITPLGSGGQPFEIYYLRKKGIPVGIASGVPIVGYAIDRTAYVIVTLTTILIYGFGNISTTIKVLCIAGLVANAIIPCAIFFFTIMPRVATALSKFVGKIAKLIRLTKDADSFSQKFVGSMTEYADCLKYFTHKSKKSMLEGFAYSVLHFIALYAIPYCTVRMCGIHDVNLLEMFALCVICYTSVTLIPTPGNSGGAELSFRSIFRSYLSGGLLFWGMMSWRILSFYSYIITGLVLIVAQQIQKVALSRKQDPAKMQTESEEDAKMRQKIKDATLPFVLEDKPAEEDQESLPASEAVASAASDKLDEDDLTYVLPTKATVNIEAEELDADTIIQTETTIDEQTEAEELLDPDVQFDQAETVAEVEVVIESTKKTVAEAVEQEHGNAQTIVADEQATTDDAEKEELSSPSENNTN